MAACILVVALLSATPSALEEDARSSYIAGDFERALQALNGLLDAPGADTPVGGPRFELEKLRARCLFELGDYPACEERLRAMRAGAARLGTSEHVECLARLAETLSLRGNHDEALGTLEQALRLLESPALQRQMIIALLRACRAGSVLPHADALLKADPAEPFAHFARGIALANENRLEEALEELAWGLAMPGAARDARFHLAQTFGKLNRPERALACLVEILADDPFDKEACYAASQQLRRIKTPRAATAAAYAQRYFLSLEEAFGETSRDHAVEALGRAAQAALMRADTWKRVSAYDRALAEIRRAQAVARGDPEPWLYEADFWAAAGLLGEAEAALARLDARVGAVAGDAAARARKLRAMLATARDALRAQAGAPCAQARLEVAQAAWTNVRPHLEALLGAALAAAEFTLADHAARLLLARDPDAVRALAFLAQRTDAAELVVPRLHYLTRLARLLPNDADVRTRLLQTRAEFCGTDTVSAAGPSPAR